MGTGSQQGSRSPADAAVSDAAAAAADAGTAFQKAAVSVRGICSLRSHCSGPNMPGRHHTRQIYTWVKTMGLQFGRGPWLDGVVFFKGATLYTGSVKDFWDICCDKGLTRYTF